MIASQDFWASLPYVGVVVAVAAAAATGLFLAARFLERRAPLGIVLAASGAIAVSALIALGQADQLLQAMHPLGRAGRGLQDVAGDAIGARAVVDAWQAWLTDPYAGRAALVEPRVLVLWSVALDAVLIAAYAIFLGTTLARIRKTINLPEVSIHSEISAQSGAPAQTQISTPATSADAWLARTAFASMLIFIAVPCTDLIENGLLLSFVEQRIDACPPECAAAIPTDGFTLWLTVAGYAKWVLLGLTIVIGLPAALLWLRKVVPEGTAGPGAAFFRVRAQLFVLGGFFVLMRLNPQTQDLIRRWDDGQRALAIIVAFLVTIVTWYAARRATHATRSPMPSAKHAQFRRLLTVLGIILVVASTTGLSDSKGPRGLIIPGVALLLLAWLDRAGENVEITAPPEVTTWREEAPAFVAAAWLVVAPLFVLDATFGIDLYDEAKGMWAVIGTFVVWGIVPVALSILTYLGLRHLGRLGRRGGRVRGTVAGLLEAERFPWLPLGFIVLGALVWIRVVQNPWATSQRLGAIALLLVFFLVVSAVAGLLTEFAERVPPPGMFALLRLRRLPIFTLLFAWLLATVLFPSMDRADYHDVRYITTRADVAQFQDLEPPVGRLDAADIWRRWTLNHPELEGAPLPDGTRRVVPMILVATEGGGIKAAAWTTIVLDCLLSETPVSDHGCQSHPQERLGSVIAESGVSGGALGLVTYTTHALSAATDGSDWIRPILGDDFVAPSLAWQMFVEIPRAWLQFRTEIDRAEVLERAWEQTWPNGHHATVAEALWGSPDPSGGPLTEGFLEQWATHPETPLMMLNGTSVQDGCKFVTLPIDGNGSSQSDNCLAAHPPALDDEALEGRVAGFLSGSRVLPDLFCPPFDDVRLSTASLMAARFPYVSPSGRIETCTDPPRAINVVDGGYLENTGSGSLLEFWRAIRPKVDEFNSTPGAGTCIVPLVLQIQSGYGPTPDRPTLHQSELLAPPQTVLGSDSAITAWQRNALELATLEVLPGTGQRGRYELVYPYAHPGAQAPLGWTLSPYAIGDLAAQLQARPNQEAFARIEGFLEDPGTCPASPLSSSAA